MILSSILTGQTSLLPLASTLLPNPTSNVAVASAGETSKSPRLSYSDERAEWITSLDPLQKMLFGQEVERELVSLPEGFVTTFKPPADNSLALGILFVFDVSSSRGAIDSNLDGFLETHFTEDFLIGSLRKRLGEKEGGTYPFQKGYQRVRSFSGMKLGLLTALGFTGEVPFHSTTFSFDDNQRGHLTLAGKVAEKGQELGAISSTNLMTFADEGDVSLGILLFQRKGRESALKGVGVDITDGRRFKRSRGRLKLWKDFSPKESATLHAASEALVKAGHPAMLELGYSGRGLAMGTRILRVMKEIGPMPSKGEPGGIDPVEGGLPARTLQHIGADQGVILWDSLDELFFSLVTIP